MSEHIKEVVAGIIGLVVTAAAVLTVILAYVYVRDGFYTDVPVLLVISAVTTLLGAVLFWKVPRMRRNIPYVWL